MGSVAPASRRPARWSHLAHYLPRKTTRPRIAGAASRPRLFRRLSVERRPVTWVWGPPGAGKTTLVASYLGSRRIRELWYQVDSTDVDIATFFYYLAQAAPARRRALPLLTPEYRPRLDVFAQRFFRALYERLTPPFVLVLDNYHDVPADATLHDVLRAAVEQLPKEGRIIIISRAEPPAAFARLRVHREFDVIGWPELRLTTAEATGVAARLSRRPTPARTIRRLHAIADGWIAGLVLLLEQRSTSDGDVSPRVAASPLLFDYFANEIFQTADSITKQILLETAFFPSFTAEMAESLTGESHAGTVVADLHRRNYFTNRRGGKRGSYQYHPLFREFLLAESIRTLTADRVDAIRRKAASLLEDAGDVDAAVQLLHDVADRTALASLICRHAPSLLAHGRVDTLEQWLAAVPEPIVASMPWVLCWRGMTRLGRRHDECRADCERALEGFRRQHDANGMLLAWSLIVLNDVMVGWLPPVDAWIVRLDDLVKEAAGAASVDIEARVATTMLLAIGFRQPGHPDGDRWAQRALELTRGHTDLILRALAATGWFFYYWQHGQLTKASVVVDEMRAIVNRRDLPSVIALHAAVPVVWHELVWALPSYRQTVVEIRERARATGLHHVLGTVVLIWGAFAALSNGDLETIEEWKRDIAQESEEWGPVFLLTRHGLGVLEALARGEVGRALAHEREIARIGYSLPNEESLGRVTAAYACHAQRLDREAQLHLERALHVAASAGLPYLEWVARLAQAHCCFERHQTVEGLDALRVAMALGRAGGYLNSAVWIPRVMAALCARALDAGIETEYVRDLVKRRRLVCEPPPLEVESWPWPIKVFTLGRFAVLSDDRPLRFSGKVQKKPLALLKAIIASGAPGVAEERLMDALWPDAEGDAARRSLTSAVFRLRQMLGHDAAITRGGGEVSLNPAYCWVDVWAVRRLLDRAESANAAADSDESWRVAAKWTERAALLYHGPIGGAEHDPPNGSLSDTLRRRLLRQLLVIAQHGDEAGEQEAAAEALNTALRVDPCAEEAYRQLMTTYQRLGRPADVKAAYRRCREALAGQLGIRPSLATEAVLRHAIKKPRRP